MKIKQKVVYNETIFMYHILNYGDQTTLDQYQEGNSQFCGFWQSESETKVYMVGKKIILKVTTAVDIVHIMSRKCLQEKTG